MSLPISPFPPGGPIGLPTPSPSPSPTLSLSSGGPGGPGGGPGFSGSSQSPSVTVIPFATQSANLHQDSSSFLVSSTISSFAQESTVSLTSLSSTQQASTISLSSLSPTRQSPTISLSSLSSTSPSSIPNGSKISKPAIAGTASGISLLLLVVACMGITIRRLRRRRSFVPVVPDPSRPPSYIETNKNVSVPCRKQAAPTINNAVNEIDISMSSYPPSAMSFASLPAPHDHPHDPRLLKMVSDFATYNKENNRRTISSENTTLVDGPSYHTRRTSNFRELHDFELEALRLAMIGSHIPSSSKSESI